jgi:hypothetical protein
MYDPIRTRASPCQSRGVTVPFLIKLFRCGEWEETEPRSQVSCDKSQRHQNHCPELVSEKQVSWEVYVVCVCWDHPKNCFCVCVCVCVCVCEMIIPRICVYGFGTLKLTEEFMLLFFLRKIRLDWISKQNCQIEPPSHFQCFWILDVLDLVSLIVSVNDWSAVDEERNSNVVSGPRSD